MNPLVDGKGRPRPFPVGASRDDSQAGTLRHGKQTADTSVLDTIASLSHKLGETKVTGVNFVRLRSGFRLLGAFLDSD